MLDLGECLSLDADNLPSLVYLSPVQTQKPFKLVDFFQRLYQLESDKLTFLALTGPIQL